MQNGCMNKMNIDTIYHIISIPWSSRLASAEPIFQKNPLSSLPPVTTRDGSVGLHETVYSSSAPIKFSNLISEALEQFIKGQRQQCESTTIMLLSILEIHKRSIELTGKQNQQLIT